MKIEESKKSSYSENLQSYEISLQKHVQALLDDEGSNITRMLLDEGGHFYVCGDCKMAEEVQQKLKDVIKRHARYSDEEAEDFILYLMVRKETAGAVIEWGTRRRLLLGKPSVKRQRMPQEIWIPNSESFEI